MRAGSRTCNSNMERSRSTKALQTIHVDSPVVSIAAVPEQFLGPWPALAHLSQPPVVRTPVKRHDMWFGQDSPVVSVAAVPEPAPCPWPLSQPPVVKTPVRTQTT